MSQNLQMTSTGDSRYRYEWRWWGGEDSQKRKIVWKFRKQLGNEISCIPLTWAKDLLLFQPQTESLFPGKGNRETLIGKGVRGAGSTEGGSPRREEGKKWSKECQITVRVLASRTLRADLNPPERKDHSLENLPSLNILMLGTLQYNCHIDHENHSAQVPQGPRSSHWILQYK